MKRIGRVYRLLCILTVLHLWVESSVAGGTGREFRGAWLHTIGQTHFTGRTTDECKNYLREQLDLLMNAGINAVIFQVRPCADAFYNSSYEPWSRYLTGEYGKAPAPFWDPLEFIIAECHARGMELHAWLNPYRSVAVNEKVPSTHLTRTEPERFIKFNGRYYFDPGLPENRDHILDIVIDILEKYDVDGIHMDDYFYPYPVKGVRFNDSVSYARYGNGMALDDWRRNNVNILISELSEVIHSFKPWVRFGISPFGIWRNRASHHDGSDTRGLQNFDDLYADVLLWAREGWIDYQAPQLYWELDHKAASSRSLAHWWNNHAYNRHLYIGQDVERSMNSDELAEKIELSRTLENVSGNVWWPSTALTSNYKNVADMLEFDYQSTFALTPEYQWLDPSGIYDKPLAPTDIAVNGNILTWKPPVVPADNHEGCSDIAGIVIYNIDTYSGIGEVENPENIIAIIRGDATTYNIGDFVDSGTWITLTSFDRLNRESEPSEPIIYLEP